MHLLLLPVFAAAVAVHQMLLGFAATVTNVSVTTVSETGAKG